MPLTLLAMDTIYGQSFFVLGVLSKRGGCQTEVLKYGY